MTVVCGQPPSLGSMPRGWRWAVFTVGMVETMLWSGTIYGWASLVHVLKIQGVYYNLCPLDQLEHLDYAPDAHNTTTHASLNHSKVSSSSLSSESSV